MNNDRITVACIIPTFNSETWISECLDSVLNQTIAFDEIIVINDGSSDSTEQICNYYCDKHGNITYISHENKKQGACRNEGIRLSRSKYVMFLDSDDIFMTDAVEKLKAFLRKNPDCVYFDAEVFGDLTLRPRGDSYIRLCDNKIIESSGKSFFDRYYPNGYNASPTLAIYRREFLIGEKIFFPEGIFYEDNLFAFKCVIKAKKIIYLPKCLYKRRYRQGSTMTGKFDRVRLSYYLDCVKLIYEYIETLDSNEISKAVIDYATGWGYGFSDRFIQFMSEGKDVQLFLKQIAELVHDFENIITVYCENNKDDSDMVKIPLFQIASVFKKYSTELVCGSYETLIRWAPNFYISTFIDMGLDAQNTDTVAIYGIGKHTEAMFDIYIKLFGRMPRNCLFVDSYKKGNSFMGQKIIGIDDVGNVDRIVISLRNKESYEIAENLKRQFPGAEVVNLFALFRFNLFRYNEYLFE